MDAFKEADLDPSDSLIKGLEKIANVEQCREVLLQLLYPDTKLLLDSNSKLLKLAKQVKAKSLEREAIAQDSSRLASSQLLSLQSSSAALLEKAKEDKSAIDTLMAQLSDLRMENERIRSELECKSNDYNELCEKGDIVSVDFLNLQKDLQIAKQKLGSYEKQLKEKSLSLEKLQELEKQNSILQSQCDELNEQLKHTSGKLDEAKSLIKRGANQISASQSDQLQLLSLFNMMNSQNEELQHKIEAMTTEINSATESASDLKKINSELSDKVSKLSKESEEYKATVTNLDEFKTKASIQLNKAKGLIEYFSEQTQTLSSQRQFLHSELQSTTKKLEASQVSLNAAKEKLDDEVSKKENLFSELTLLQQENARLSAQDSRKESLLEQSQRLLEKTGTSLQSLDLLESRIADVLLKAKETNKRNQVDLSRVSLELEGTKLKLESQSSQHENVLGMLSQSVSRISSMNEAQDELYKELKTKQKQNDNLVVILEQTLEFKSTLKRQLKSAKQVIDEQNTNTRTLNEKNSFLEKDLNITKENLKSCLENLRVQTADNNLIMEQKKALNNTVSRLYCTIQETATKLEQLKADTTSCLLCFQDQFIDSQKAKNDAIVRLRKCLDILTTIHSDYQSDFKARVEAKLMGQQELTNTLSQRQYLKQQCSKLKQTTILQEQSVTDLNEFVKRALFIIATLVNENQNLKSVLIRFKFMYINQQRIAKQHEVELEKNYTEKTVNRLRLLTKAKDTIIVLQKGHKSDFTKFCQLYNKRTTEGDTLRIAQLEQRDRKLAESVKMMKTLVQTFQSTLNLKNNNIISLQCRLESSRQQLQTTAEHNQKHLKELKRQTDSLSRVCSRQSSTTKLFARYLSETILYNASLKATILSYKNRLSCLHDLNSSQQHDNRLLNSQLLTLQCKSTEPYIKELERRITLLQGQVSEANDKNVQMMELLQIKLRQDVHGRITKQQAEREVSLLREMVSK